MFFTHSNPSILTANIVKIRSKLRNSLNVEIVIKTKTKYEWQFDISTNHTGRPEHNRPI